MSKGYRQRVGLADALVADPQILILDEPTSGLDPIQIRETLNTIQGLAGRHTVLLSTHILSEVEAVCDRVVIISRGTIRWDGRMTQLDDRAPTLLVEVRGPADAVAAFLAAEKGVRSAARREATADAALFEVEADDAAALLEPLAKKIVEKGWGLRRLALKRRRLDDLYAEVVLRRDHHAAPAAAPAPVAAVS